MNLRERLLTQKKLTYNSPSRAELFNKVLKYGITHYQEAVYFYLNDFKEIPKCPYSEENQYFERTYYVGCSKQYYKFIKHDTHIKGQWLSWKNLFDKGLTLEKAYELLHSKKLLKVRLTFIFDVFNEKILSNILKQKGYLENVIEDILRIDFSTSDGICKFIDMYDNLQSAKNNTLRWFLNRGYSDVVAKEKLYDFQNTWKKFSEKIDKNSERYKKWLKSRKPGLNAVRKSLRSKFEKKIFNDLQNIFKIDLKCYTKINNLNFSKSMFKHDFFINDCLIVEYNGSYWHKDMFTDKRFNDLDLYKLEILRADIAIKTHNCKYLILWENDINGDMSIVKKLICDALAGKEFFYSSRKIDTEFYNMLITG